MAPAFGIDALLWEILDLPLETQLMCAFQTKTGQNVNSLDSSTCYQECNKSTHF